MLTNVDSTIFTTSPAVELQPIVSAEWNQNLFNPPYLTTAGLGILETVSYFNGATVTSIGQDITLPGFNTYSFKVDSGSAYVDYSVTTANSSSAYNVVFWVKTDNPIPLIISAYGVGTDTQYGSSSTEVNSFGWTKITTVIGSSGPSDGITSFNFVINANNLDSDTTPTNVLFTEPEVYQTTYQDYQYGSLWPTDAPFTYFRPGDSYVTTGNANCSLPSGYRSVSTQLVANQASPTYFPLSPIVQAPGFTMASAPVPFYKNALPNDMSAYKYFISETSSRSISSIYNQLINVNKIVIKFNAIMTTPTINLFIDETQISVDGSTSISTDSKGLIILYWTGSTWTKNQWSTMPQFNSSGSLTTYTSFKKIAITQISQTVKSEFSGYTNGTFVSDITRMQLIELSPRLEIDLTNFTKDVTINKSLDSKNNFVPISSINADDASITLSAIPVVLNNGFVPVFSSQSNLSTNVLSNMLRKNIKFYLGWTLKSYFSNSAGTFTQLNGDTGTYIPAGVFYSDSWDETDIKDVQIVAYDITRYLQTLPSPDYVANLKPVSDVISNILDLAGFTDYDYDSLYSVSNDKTMPLDLAYYYVNSKDTTVIDAISQIFLAYQIGAFIDEYGVMQFRSLSGILSSSNSSLTISDSSIITEGYSITNKAKPGKLSLRYQPPKIKQSLALQNATDPTIKNDPSFVYTTSNDVVWQQSDLDSVGFNYLYYSMGANDNKYTINKNDLLDVFHSFSLNNNGYAVIENEIVSFVYKQYKISNLDGSNPMIISVKNDLELSSYVNQYIKRYETGLVVSSNVDSTGSATTKSDYNVLVSPYGVDDSSQSITNVQRGLFGTVPSAHTVFASGQSISTKGLTEGVFNSSYTLSSGSNTSWYNTKTNYPSLPGVNKISVQSAANTKTLVYSNTADQGYQTYSAKFDLTDQQTSASGIFFNQAGSNASGSYFVELIKFNTATSGTASYRYIIAVYSVSGSTSTVITWADVTGQANYIIANFQKVLTKVTGTGINSSYTYASSSDQTFNLRATHYYSDGTDQTLCAGEQVGEIIEIFLNNIEITGWQIPDARTVDSNGYGVTGWKAKPKNSITGLRQKNMLTFGGSALNFTGKNFGFYTSTKPVAIAGLTYPNTVTSTVTPAHLQEIYACQKPLKERSVNYYFQDREFLNGLIQGNKLFSKYKSYMMQTTPQIVGINTYDVQYTNPAAVSVDILPISYLWYYFPGTTPIDQQYYQQQIVDEYSLAYSTPINTGFRARMAIVNNSSHMVYLSKQSDNLNQFTINLNLWTHEIVAPSDPEVIEKIVDPVNATEVAQIDSPWIQSEQSANRLMAVIEKGFDGFSRDTQLIIFGNPMIQVGDIITVNYTLSKLNQQKYTVHSVSHEFNQGLKTTLVLNQIDKGVSY